MDALNPDIVRYHGRYLMFFSGNDVHTPAGRWKTGLAVSHSPAGRFRLTKLRGDYFNGGTVVWRGWLYQTRELNSGGGELARSRDGLRWQHVAPIPIYPRKGYPLIADYALRPVKRALRLYALARRSAVGLGGDIVALDFLDGRWRSPQTLLSPSPLAWEDVDLGEPYAFTVAGASYMLYVGTGRVGFVRQIGLARLERRGWLRCSARPFIATGARWGPRMSIDPSALVERDRLYVYFGGGTRTSIASDLGGAIGVRVFRIASG